MITIGARISEQLDRDSRTLAAATGRSKSWLIAEALKSYVEAEKEFIEAVEERIKAADEGRLVDHDAVVLSLSGATGPHESSLDRSGAYRLSADP
jgi:RHH-type rel operon transcriptional repressor/antitoxin RelB